MPPPSNKYSRKESVTSMLDDLEWPPIQQRRAEWRLALFHRIVNGTEYRFGVTNGRIKASFPKDK